MPLFHVVKDTVQPISQSNFATERDLQTLVERNLGVIFNCALVASEFSTGSQHAGRIDTLALSEDMNPVIIEYKKVESSDLINQSLFYLAWLNDHRGDFEVAAHKALSGKFDIDWSDIRVICIAPNYKKYDLHAVQMMGASIELWSYRRFSNNTVYLEEVFHNASVTGGGSVQGKNPVMVAAGKKAAVTKAAGGWTFAQAIEGKPDSVRELAHAVQDFMLAIDSAIEEAPKKFYVAYRTTQNVVCMEVQKKKILLFLKLDPAKGPHGISRDVSHIGHYGTGDLEITIRTAADLEKAKPFLRQSYEQMGG